MDNNSAFSPTFTITPEIMNTILEIERLRERVRQGVILPVHEVELRYRATVESVHSSTSIEGNPLTLRQTEAVLDGHEARLSRSKIAETEVTNYRDALNHISERARTGRPISEADVLTIHYLITQSLLDPSRVGHFRKNPVYVESSSGELVYTAASPASVRQKVSDLLEWLTDKHELHPLIRAALFHLQFVSIHPFADGNGRTTRALTTLYLALTHYDFRGSLALDTYFSSERQAYYQALRAEGDTFAAREAADATPWVEYFLAGVLACAKVLAAEISVLSTAVGRTNIERPKITRDQMDILDYVERFGEITAAEVDEILTGGRRTAQRKIKELVDLGYLIKIGASRDIRYTKHVD
ncbi:Fic family protein [Candidatus Saccharibacteria bacterium]|nr:Fic family protein [Candidatus Saccharibacteria bacterium]